MLKFSLLEYFASHIVYLNQPKSNSTIPVTHSMTKLLYILTIYIPIFNYNGVIFHFDPCLRFCLMNCRQRTK